MYIISREKIENTMELQSKEQKHDNKITTNCRLKFKIKIGRKRLLFNHIEKKNKSTKRNCVFTVLTVVFTIDLICKGNKIIL